MLKVYKTAQSVNASLNSGRAVFGILQLGGHRVRITGYKVTLRGIKGPWAKMAGTRRWVPVSDVEVGPAKA